MSCFPEVCTPKEHFEQNLERRREKRGLDSMPVMEALHSLGERGAKDNSPALFLHKSLARGSLVEFLPFPVL